jgi:hypothetical protein
MAKQVSFHENLSYYICLFVGKAAGLEQAAGKRSQFCRRETGITAHKIEVA